MIYLEIIKSNEPLALGVYEFEFNQISIGRSKKNDLIFLDQELPLQFLSIKFVQNYLIVQSFTRSPAYFVNGKKISGVLKIKNNDIIAFGSNQIKILHSAQKISEQDFTADYENFNKKSPELKFALDFIEQVLLDLEKDTHV